MPEGGHCGAVTLPGAVRLRYARWGAKGNASRGTILLLHGRTEFIEKYYETIEDLRRLGFAVLTFDWRGQGASSRLLSDPLKGHIEHFDQYLDDLDAILRQVLLPDCPPPHYLVGHSTGALMALLSAPALTNRIDRMVLCAPFLKLQDLPMPQRYFKRLLGFLTYVGFGRSYVPDTRGNIDRLDFAGNKLTSDPERLARRNAIIGQHRHLAISGPTIAWLYSAFRAAENVSRPEFAASIKIPAQFILGTADKVISTPFAEYYASRMRAGAHLTIPGARHEILQEKDIYREQALAAIDAFLP